MYCILYKKLHNYYLMKYTSAHLKFENTINKLLQTTNSYSILIAISGGQDSLCLIKLIEDIVTNYSNPLKIEYIYIDHQWRKDSENNIKHLINFINTTQYSLTIYELPDITLSELDARKLRYQVLIHHAIQYNYKTIMTAHTQTDKIETFFYQLIRGTSIDGATSLTMNRHLTNKIRLYRPLINFQRAEIYWFCRKFFLPIWSDLTNYKYITQRNRIRYELIPYLNQYFHTNIHHNIRSFLNISEIDNEYLKQNAIKLYLISIHRYNIAINYALIQKQHASLQYRTIQLFFYHHFNKTLQKCILEKVISAINVGDKIYIQINWNNLIINIHNNWIYIN